MKDIRDIVDALYANQPYKIVQQHETVIWKHISRAMYDKKISPDNMIKTMRGAKNKVFEAVRGDLLKLKNQFPSINAETVDKMTNQVLDFSNNVLKENGVKSITSTSISRKNFLEGNKSIQDRMARSLSRNSGMISRSYLKGLPAAWQQTTIAMKANMLAGLPPREAARKTMTKMLRENNKVWTIKDKAGRLWKPHNYYEMVYRTEMMKDSNTLAHDNYKANGITLVLTSQHSDSSLICEPWQNQVLSLDGDSEEYPSMTDAESEGYHHPNCRHFEMPYIEGVTQAQKPISKKVLDKKRKERIKFRDMRKRQSYNQQLRNIAKDSGDIEILKNQVPVQKATPASDIMHSKNPIKPAIDKSNTDAIKPNKEVLDNSKIIKPKVNNIIEEADLYKTRKIVQDPDFDNTHSLKKIRAKKWDGVGNPPLNAYADDGILESVWVGDGPLSNANNPYLFDMSQNAKLAEEIHDIKKKISKISELYASGNDEAAEKLIIKKRELLEKVKAERVRYASHQNAISRRIIKLDIDEANLFNGKNTITPELRLKAEKLNMARTSNTEAMLHIFDDIVSESMLRTSIADHLKKDEAFKKYLKDIALKKVKGNKETTDFFKNYYGKLFKWAEDGHGTITSHIERAEDGKNWITFSKRSDIDERQLNHLRAIVDEYRVNKTTDDLVEALTWKNKDSSQKALDIIRENENKFRRTSSSNPVYKYLNKYPEKIANDNFSNPLHIAQRKTSLKNANSFSKSLAKNVDNLKLAIDAPEDMYLWRGSDDNELRSILKTLKADGTARLPHYSSTSIDGIPPMFGGNVRVVVKVKKGMRLMDMNPLSPYKEQSEILLNRGQRFRLKSIIDSKTMLSKHSDLMEKTLFNTNKDVDLRSYKAATESIYVKNRVTIVLELLD